MFDLVCIDHFSLQDNDNVCFQFKISLVKVKCLQFHLVAPRIVYGIFIGKVWYLVSDHLRFQITSQAKYFYEQPFEP